MQNWPIIFHRKLLLSLVLRIHDVIKFTILSSLQNAKTYKTFSSLTELPDHFCRACSLLFEDVRLCLLPLCVKRQTLQQPLCWGPGQTNALSPAAQLAAGNGLDSAACCLARGISTLSLQPISGKQNLKYWRF